MGLRSVFDASAVRTEFDNSGINTHFIPLIWKWVPLFRYIYVCVYDYICILLLFVASWWILGVLWSGFFVKLHIIVPSVRVCECECENSCILFVLCMYIVCVYEWIEEFLVVSNLSWVQIVSFCKKGTCFTTLIVNGKIFRLCPQRLIRYFAQSLKLWARLCTLLLIRLTKLPPRCSLSCR